jgi:hypothetical protein
MDPSAAAKGRRAAGLKLFAPASVGRWAQACVAQRPTGGMPLASPVGAVPVEAPMSRPHVSHGGLSMPASGLFSVTLSATSLSQSLTGR